MGDHRGEGGGGLAPPRDMDVLKQFRSMCLADAVDNVADSRSL